MATEPITYFRNRVEAVTTALRMAGAVPIAAKDMCDADDKITGVMDMFDERTTAIPLSEYTEAGAKWAKKPTKGGLERLVELLDAPVGDSITTVPVRVKEAWGENWQNVTASTTHSRRLAAARKGALEGLIAKYDKPEYSTAALIESCKDAVRASFDRMTTEFYEAWEGLDDEARATAGRSYRMDSILELIDPATTPEATITASRRAVRAWARIDGDENFEEHSRLARAMAFNDVSETPNSDRDLFDRLEAMTRNRARFRALMFDAQTCALCVLGMNPLKAVNAGLGKLAPLVDPLGDDLPELEHRIDAISAVDDWFDYRKRTVGDPYRGKGWHEPYERFGMATPEQSLAALKEYKPAVFHAAATSDDEAAPVADNEAAEDAE